jgi:hypothetical protein
MAPFITHSAAIMAMLAGALVSAESFCTFYTESFCKERSGSVNYAVENNGIFQNGGPYFSCRTEEEFSLISYPAGDSNGDNPKHCHVFNEDEKLGCNHLDDLGFTTGDGGYYRLSLSKTCPSTSEKREVGSKEAVPLAVPSTSEKREVKDKVVVPFGRNNTEADVRRRNELRDMLRRNADYFRFYDDPDCKQQSGGVGYSTHNDGCFENGGAYGLMNGGDSDYHIGKDLIDSIRKSSLTSAIEQYQGTDGDQCTGDQWHCVTSEAFAPNNLGYPPCVHLDDVGLQSGFGSYRIGRHGCP